MYKIPVFCGKVKLSVRPNAEMFVWINVVRGDVSWIHARRMLFRLVINFILEGLGGTTAIRIY
jgi:hypothetical protein